MFIGVYEEEFRGIINIMQCETHCAEKLPLSLEIQQIPPGNKAPTSKIHNPKQSDMSISTILTLLQSGIHHCIKI